MKTKLSLNEPRASCGLAAPKVLLMLAVVAALAGAGYWMATSSKHLSADGIGSEHQAGPQVEATVQNASSKPQSAPSPSVPVMSKEESNATETLNMPLITGQHFQDSEAIQAWAKQDPAALMTWLGTTAVPQIPADGSPAGLRPAVAEWSQKDIKACAAWFGAHQDYRYYDYGVGYLVEYLTPVDLNEARNWLATIKNDGVRSHAASMLVRNMPKPGRN